MPLYNVTVNTSGTQTVGGIKTFTSNPVFSNSAVEAQFTNTTTATRPFFIGATVSGSAAISSNVSTTDVVQDTGQYQWRFILSQASDTFQIQRSPAGATWTPTIFLSISNTGSLTMTDAANLIVGSTTGTKIATATTQKLGFYNVTPIAQRSGAAQAAVVATSATNVTPFGYATAAQADAIVTLVNELRAWAVAQGFIKGSA